MKYISKCALSEIKIKSCGYKCRSRIPHDFKSGCCDSSMFSNECMYAPVSLSYYMKKISEKDKK